MVPGSTSLLRKRTISEMLFPEQSVLKRSSRSQLPVSLNRSIITSDIITLQVDKMAPIRSSQSVMSTDILDISRLATGSKLPVTWSRGGASIDLASLGWNGWNKGMITRDDLLGPPPGTPFISGGAGHWLATPIPQPTIGAADTQEDIFRKFAEYGKILAQSRKQFQSTIEHLFANVVPPSFILPSPLSPTAGSFAAQVLENPDCSCFVDLATQMATIGLTTAKNAMGKSSEIATDASKSLENIRVLAKDKRFPVPASAIGLPGAAGHALDAGNRLRVIRSHDPGAIVSAEEIGMPGGAGRNIDAGLLLAKKRREKPNAIFSAAEVDMTGCAGQSVNASIRLREIRRENPYAIVSAEEVGMPGGPGKAMNAAILLRKNYCNKLDSQGIVFKIKQRGMQQQENVSPEKTLKFLESQYAQHSQNKSDTFVVFQKAVNDPKKWHEFADGHFMAHTPTAVDPNESSPRNAFTAMDGLGLPAAPVPSGGRPQDNCPLCGKEMRSDHIERHKNKRNCVQRQKKNLENN